MIEPIDHEVKIRYRASEWLALKREAERDDRALSAYIRRVTIEHLKQVSAMESDRDRDEEG